MLKSFLYVQIISKECKTKYKWVQKLRKQGNFKLKNWNKSAFLTKIYTLLQICRNFPSYELVGLYILDILKKEKIFSDGNFGIYRDDGLAVIDILPGPGLESKVKQLRKVFTNIGFDVTIEANLFVTDFLDVTLDLQDESYKPYRKPNAHTVYVNSKSNHPEHVLKHIPVAVNNRLQKISSNQSIF